MGVRSKVVATAATWWARDAVRVYKLPPSVIASTLDSVCGSDAAACVIGVLPSPETVSRVLERLVRRGAARRVLRPTVFNRMGARILSSEGVARLRGFIPGMACVIADLPDALALCGGPMAAGFQGDLGAAAAAGLVTRGTATALVRDPVRAVTYLSQATRCEELPGVFEARGAGWALATAVASFLARGEETSLACQLAHAWIMGSGWQNDPPSAGAAQANSPEARRL